MQTKFFAGLLTSNEMGLPIDSDSQLIANAGTRFGPSPF